ncbi:hypothetical protein DENSPDRAFT_856145 [Dentipellis sp. KUC8613]|nr:hypothetical protein DENSPDRAFT_856145 [Dentipellis sp. KUC8613]
MSPTVRVIVRLPYNRPEHPPPEPAPIDWNTEKENYLWDVIAKSRATEGSVTDWKALATRLGVPLPYLLYRAQIRYEQDLRGLQDITGALSPQSTHTQSKVSDDTLHRGDRPSLTRRDSSRLSTTGKLSSSVRLNTPLGVRARLNSLGANSPARVNKISSSSVITLQGRIKEHEEVRRSSPISSGSGTESEGDGDEADQEAGRLEEQEALDNKLMALQKLMTDDSLGLVSSPRPKHGKDVDRGRHTVYIGDTRVDPQDRFRRDNLSRSQSISSTSSPQGSIPSMPSPPPESHSPMSRHLSPPGKSTSPAAVSPRSVRGQTHMRQVLKAKASEKGSNQGSSASSFSDLSEASLSASALESALQSNFRSGGSRL